MAEAATSQHWFIEHFLRGHTQGPHRAASIATPGPANTHWCRGLVDCACMPILVSSFLPNPGFVVPCKPHRLDRIVGILEFLYKCRPACSIRGLGARAAFSFGSRQSAKLIKSRVTAGIGKLHPRGVARDQDSPPYLSQLSELENVAWLVLDD